MREIYGFLRLANPFGHPSQVRTQVLVLQTCVDLRRLVSPFGQGFKALSVWSVTSKVQFTTEITSLVKSRMGRGRGKVTQTSIHMNQIPYLC